MKLKLQKTIYMLSKYFLYGFLMQLLVFNFVLATTVNGQYKLIDEVEVRVNKKSTNLNELFRIIEDQSPFTFLYDHNAVDGENRVELKSKTGTVENFLREVSLQTNLKFRQVNNGIDVKPGREQASEALLFLPISGTVVDENGEAIPGATILEKGTSNGTATDIDGTFKLEVGEGAVLIVSFVGYEPQQVEVGNRSEIHVILEFDTQSLEEVVVIGYGTARRKDISGAVGTIDLEDSPVSLSPNTNALQSLQGSMPGINVGTQASPGTNPSILIRGQNSINGSNTPLIVVDGIIYLGDLTDLNPDDIASIDVMKDASSAAVYGSRAANGVIAISTKKGKTQKPVIKYNGWIGANQWPSPPEMMNLDQWTQKFVAQRPSFNSPDDIVFDDITRRRLFAQGVETDFMDLVSRNGFIQNHQIGVSGRSESINYYFSGGYNHNNGAIVGDQYERISVRSKLDANITDWLEVGLDGTFNRNDYSGIGANLNLAYLMSPFGYPYRWDEMPENPGGSTSTKLERYPTGSSIPSPLWGTDDTIQDEDVRNFYRLATYAFVQIPTIEGLSYRFNLSLNSDNDIQNRFYHEDYYVGEQLEQPFIDRYSAAQLSLRLSQANGYNNITNRYSYVMDNIINYKKNIDKHYVDLTLVATRDRTRTKVTKLNGSDYSENGNTLLGYNGIHKASVQRTDLDITERSNIGYLGRLNYAFDNKYHVTATFRRDGSSVFGRGNKWGNFPSLGFAWTVTEENFAKSLEVMDYLKLKASYGKNGNQGVSPYGTLASVRSGSDGGIRYEFGDDPSRILYGVQQSNLGSPDLGWETTTSFNGGFQSSWMENRVFLDLDFYFSKTTNQIFQRQIPIMTGFSSIISSLGQVDNKGIEVNLRTINIKNENFRWSSNLLYWKNRNEIASLYGDDLDGDGVEDDDISNNLFVGKSLGAIYGYKYIGVVQAADTDYIDNTGAVPGDPKFQDLSGPEGVPDGIITADYDRQILGYRKENFRLSLANTLEYRNFSFYVMFTGVFGGGKDNFYQKENPLHNSFGDRFDTNEVNHGWWTAENQSTYYLRPDYVGNRYLGLQSQTFVRIQDVSLSYSVPRDILDKYKINSLEFYSSVKNLHVFTDWFGGGDPEGGRQVNAGAYPIPRTYSLGMKVSF
ncbi:SusC/RagA family TonB-linked outer membrane protein [Echinicola pacifica]|uniref:SusC/RagA family TonB-linked outer membrane protein n=1 Tax=Echinicola pacifica TaxID=346377 RepID=A0A918PKC9_9BACT|nr:TonB-dependent receptor [Echinicola pacifica]GGZ13412.1 SusC/RagA family TonB-linked outer membrane protein [Echinicola pacifica]